MPARLTELRLTEFKTFRDAALPIGDMTVLISRRTARSPLIETGYGTRVPYPETPSDAGDPHDRGKAAGHLRSVLLR
jgi:hypothetical protein